MSEQLERKNTTTTFSSFWCASRQPSLVKRVPVDNRPAPPPNYEHVDDVPQDEVLAAFAKVAYPRNKSIDLRASKLDLVEMMSPRERLNRWQFPDRDGAADPAMNPLEKWRQVVATEVEKENKRQRLAIKEKELREFELTHAERVVSEKPSVLTTSSVRSATAELQRALESSSPFARSFGVETLDVPSSSASFPTSSIVRETFLSDERQGQASHPYASPSELKSDSGHLPATAEEVLLAPAETNASVSPIDPAFTPRDLKSPLTRQRCPLPRIDTVKTPASSSFSSSPVSAPSIHSVHTPTPTVTSLPPPVPPKDPNPYALLPPKAAALLGLIPSAHAPFATPRPPRPMFAARERQNSLSSSSETYSVSTEPYRSSFYTNYDGPPLRPSYDCSSSTSLTCPSSQTSTVPLPITQNSKKRSQRPAPLTLHRAGASSLPNLPETLAGPHSSASSSSQSTSIRARGASLETPRKLHHVHSNADALYERNHARAQTTEVVESEIEDLMDPAALVPRSPPFPEPHNTTMISGNNLVRSLSQRGRGLARKLSTKRSNLELSNHDSETERAQPRTGGTHDVKIGIRGRKSLKDLKKGFDKFESSIKYW
ncbi:uncharacterized protein JCM15063_000919 [Sporobolomyces koalae]|uniref:uncharacterized protein n=1 Tax=Sporobolomyces koalae TaxID=500713 RepID=UPI0031824929